jgi:hypothetical protein
MCYPPKRCLDSAGEELTSTRGCPQPNPADSSNQGTDGLDNRTRLVPQQTMIEPGNGGVFAGAEHENDFLKFSCNFLDSCLVFSNLLRTVEKGPTISKKWTNT